MKKRFNKGFTLVEVMVVAGCLALLLTPIFFILRSGTKTSLVGMMKIDTTLEARRIIKQVRSDLKLAIIPLSHHWKPGVTIFPSFSDILKEEGTPPNTKYVFYSYPMHHPLYDGGGDDIIHNRNSTKGYSPRNISKITYKLEDSTNPDKPFLKLIRVEEFNSNVREKVLSDRVNFFRIRRVPITPGHAKNQDYFFITLQLIDSLDSRNFKKIAEADIGKKKASQQSHIVLADFFDIVYPEYFHALWNFPQTNPSWHTFPVNLPD